MLITSEANSGIVKIRLVVVVKEGNRNWLPLHRELVSAVIHPGLVVDWHNEEGPLKEIRSAEDARTMGKYVVRAAEEAETLGFDAVAVDCLLEPGVREARERIRIPIVGAIEASLALGSRLGKKIAFVVCGNDTDSLQKLVQSYPGGEHVVLCLGVGGTPLDFADPAKLDLNVERMERGVRRAIESGAEVVIGYGSLSLIRELQRRTCVPILSPVQAVVLYAEHLVRVMSATGVGSERRRRNE